MPPSTAHSGFEPTQHYQRHARVALTPGSRVGEFEIVRVLGVGGFSIVYLARDQALNRLVAVKEYLPSALATRGEGAQVELRTSSNGETFEQGLASFIKEARMLARFDHPSLVRVHHFWKANGTAYMAMRYLEGVTLLAARRAMPRPPDEAWLRALLGSLLGAIEALHAESCYHRDISPDNILLLTDGTPVLLDFGAARSIAGDGSQQVTAILKPGFAPIEQYAEATDLRQGPWTDLYALGAVVRNCITARPPIPATVRAVGDRLPSLALEVRTLAATFPGLNYSPGFLAAIDWALALRPADRPQSVAQFRHALTLQDAIPLRPGAAAPDGLAPAVAQPRPPGAVIGFGRALVRARDAAAALATLWPGRTPARTAPAAARAEGSAAPEASASQPTTTPLPHVQATALWPLSRAGLRRAMPWSVAAVLVGAVASVGWRSFEERQIGHDMAVMASSAAAAAEEAATPVAFAAPQELSDETAPAVIYTRQPPASQLQDGLPVVAMSTQEEAEADPGADIITEPRESAMAAEPGAHPLLPPNAAGAVNPMLMERGLAGAPRALRASRGEPARSAPSGAGKRGTVTARGGDSPRAICARQERYTDYVCMRRQCKLTQFRSHAQCESLRKTGWWGFIRLP